MHEWEQKQIFDEWLQKHKGILFKIVRAYAFTAADQDDLFQEIALQVWRSIPDFRGESKASTWIYRVALYAASAWTRREQRQPPTKPLDAVAQTLTMTAQPSAGISGTATRCPSCSTMARRAWDCGLKTTIGSRS